MEPVIRSRRLNRHVLQPDIQMRIRPDRQAHRAQVVACSITVADRHSSGARLSCVTYEHEATLAATGSGSRGRRVRRLEVLRTRW